VAETEAIRQDAVKRSRAVLSGQFSEQLAPFLPGFPWRPTEARFIGKPVDFIVFKGMDEKEISEIVFVEVKSGNAQLSQQERRLRDAVLAKRVSWHEYRVPDGLTGERQHDKS
jgi:predicted Holliday junction resolvase-like endonuclease